MVKYREHLMDDLEDEIQERLANLYINVDGERRYVETKDIRGQKRIEIELQMSGIDTEPTNYRRN